MENRTAPGGVAVASTGGRSLNGLAVRLAAVAVSLLLVALLVVTSSQAAFTATTSNTANAASTGSVRLSDNDAGSALFDVSGLAPGTPVDRCIEVTYQGDLDAGPVRLYSSGPPTGDLAPYLGLTVDIGPDTPGAFGSCAGFTSTATLHPGTRSLADFDANVNSWPNGLDTWDPDSTTAGRTRTFRFRIEVRDDNAAQAKSTTFGFTWEARSS